MGRAWIMLFIGIAFEVSGTTTMRALAENHEYLSLLAATLGISASYFFASRAMEIIPVGIAYAAWSGIGLAGIAVLSYFLFAEPMPLLKLLGLALIIWGMVVINLNKSASANPHGKAEQGKAE